MAAADILLDVTPSFHQASSLDFSCSGVLNPIATPDSLSNQPKTRECPVCACSWDRALTICPRDGSSLLSPIEIDPIFKTYEFLGVLGSGGMGIIYKARHTVMEKFVAIKMLHPHLLSQQAVRRFQIEGKAAGMLEHPLIIKVFDLGVSASCPYMIMEYVEGQTLAEVLQTSGPLSLERFLSVFIDACDALEHAHTRGVLHRDLKPSNLMLRRNIADVEEIRIMDFGIAKLVDESIRTVHAAHLTRTGEAIGSPLYMSPEQARATGTDARSDLYSLGCVMYEALTGVPPFTANTALEVMLMHMNDTACTMTQATLGARQFEPALESVVSRLLEKNPDLRYQNMGQLKADLMAVRDGKGLAAPAPQAKSAAMRVELWKTIAALLAAVTVMSLISCIILTQSAIAPDQVVKLDDQPLLPATRRLLEDEIKNRNSEIILGPMACWLCDDDLAPLKYATDAQAMSLRNATSITSSGLRYLSQLPLRRLQLDNCSGIYSLSALRHMPCLLELGLSNTNIGDDELMPLSELKLEIFDLSGTNVHSLEALKNMQSLKELRLQNTRIGTEAMTVIGRLRNLEGISLRSTPIQDSDLRCIMHLPRLRSILLDGCPRLSDAAVRNLQSVLPRQCLLSFNFGPGKTAYVKHQYR